MTTNNNNTPDEDDLDYIDFDDDYDDIEDDDDDNDDYSYSHSDNISRHRNCYDDSLLYCQKKMFHIHPLTR